MDSVPGPCLCLLHPGIILLLYLPITRTGPLFVSFLQLDLILILVRLNLRAHIIAKLIVKRLVHFSFSESSRCCNQDPESR